MFSSPLQVNLVEGLLETAFSSGFDVFGLPLKASLRPCPWVQGSPNRFSSKHLGPGPMKGPRYNKGCVERVDG